MEVFRPEVFTGLKFPTSHDQRVAIARTANHIFEIEATVVAHELVMAGHESSDAYVKKCQEARGRILCYACAARKNSKSFTEFVCDLVRSHCKWLQGEFDLEVPTEPATRPDVFAVSLN